MKVRERSTQRKIIDWAEDQGIWIVKYPAGVYGKKGTGDLILCVDGRYVGFEVKRVGEDARPLQLYRQAEVRKSGGVCEVVESLDEAVAVIGMVMGWGDGSGECVRAFAKGGGV